MAFNLDIPHVCLHSICKIKETNARDNYEYSPCIFLDLEKSVNTIEHRILLCKLEQYGIEDKEVHWFKTYLGNSQQQAISLCN